MEIRTTNTKGLFCLMWRDSGISGGEYFTRIETISSALDTDVTLWREDVPGTTLNLDTDAVDGFFQMIADVNAQVDVINKTPSITPVPSSAKDGFFKEDAA